MKPKFQKLFSEMAASVAKLSYSRILHVGAIIVKNDRVISMGYNGMPAGWENNCEDIVWDSGAGGWLDPEEFDKQYPHEAWHEEAGRNVRYSLKTKREALHAESNAIAKLAKTDGGGDGADIFITHAPCIDCAKLIYQSGISRVFYDNNYKNDTGIKFLKQSGIKVIKNDE
jgi:dCMP deaminase